MQPVKDGSLGAELVDKYTGFVDGVREEIAKVGVLVFVDNL
jgi:hypothetical protein